MKKTLILCLLITLSACVSRIGKKETLYKTPEYTFWFKDSVAILFDSIVNKKRNECSCVFSQHNSRKEKGFYRSIVIEPLYVNTDNCIGVYAKRFHHRYRTIKYKNGFIPHFIFFYNKKGVKEFRREDSLQMKKMLLKKGSGFTEVYTRMELETIYDKMKGGTISSTKEALPIYNIKEKGVIIYDVHNETNP